MSSLQIKTGSIVAGRYRILRSIKISNESARYEVESVSDGHPGCLKIFPAELIPDTTLRHRFANHIRASSNVRSPHVLAPQEAGVEPGSGLIWFVTDLLSGDDLEEVLKQRGELQREEAIALLTQVGAALQAIHSAGQVHGNLKPRNIFLTCAPDSTSLHVRLLNLGVSSALAEAKPASAMAQGTPIWMAPEQTTTGEVLRPTVDVWAFGLLAFRLLTGHVFWREGNKRPPSPLAVMREVSVDSIGGASERAREYGAAELPAGFDDWFSACVQRDAVARYQSGTEAAESLAEVVAGRPARKPVVPVAPAGSEPAPGAGVATSGRHESLAASPRNGSGGRDKAPAQPAAPPSRWRLLRWLVPLLLFPVVVTGSFDAYRRQHKQQVGRLCELPAVSREALLRRFAACQELCTGGGAQQCLQVGRLMLQHKIEAEHSAETAAQAYEQACDLNEPAGCRQLGMMYWEGNQGLKKDRTKSIEFLLRACDGNDKPACAQVSEVSLDEVKRPEDQERILRVIEQACQKNEPASCAQLGRLHLLRNDLARAFALLERACKEQDAQACAQAGQLAVQGTGLKKDAVVAFRLFQRACDKGFSAGCYWLAQLYERGEGTKKDVSHAVEIYRRDCENGGAESCHTAAIRALSSGNERDRKQAIAWLKRACELGNQSSCGGVELPAAKPEREKIPSKDRGPSEAQLVQMLESCRTGNGESCFRLATLFERGQAVQKDRHRAHALYQLACRHNVIEGCQQLKIMEEDGPLAELGPNAFCSPDDGCVQQGETGSRVKTRACGNALSCLNLGHMYHTGQDVPRDLDRAAEAFRQSCSLGNGEGCTQLGLMYERGETIGRDLKRAVDAHRKGCSIGNGQACERLRALSEPSTETIQL